MTAKTTYRQNFLRNSLMIVSCFAVFYSASSASFYSGGGKKKNTKSTLTSINLKNNPLSLQNGFRFKSGFTFSSTTGNTNSVVKGSTVTFQKGNTLYVLPVKQKVILSKFKTPQKEIK
ncbi:MAG: hypothetical protein GXC73_18715 [Chitinophagaceae bacterium]|nr:hypothetical protein [Chitinophagaceae bacterium]